MAEGRRGSSELVLPLIDEVSIKHLFEFFRSYNGAGPCFLFKSSEVAWLTGAADILRPS